MQAASVFQSAGSQFGTSHRLGDVRNQRAEEFSRDGQDRFLKNGEDDAGHGDEHHHHRESLDESVSDPAGDQRHQIDCYGEIPPEQRLSARGPAVGEAGERGQRGASCRGVSAEPDVLHEHQYPGEPGEPAPDAAESGHRRFAGDDRVAADLEVEPVLQQCGGNQQAEEGGAVFGGDVGPEDQFTGTLRERGPENAGSHVSEQADEYRKRGKLQWREIPERNRAACRRCWCRAHADPPPFFELDCDDRYAPTFLSSAVDCIVMGMILTRAGLA